MRLGQLTHRLLLLLPLTLLCPRSVIGDDARISSASEFITFLDNIKNGTTYSGTTVLLDSDLSFTGKTFEPINNGFRGDFDGQGYTVSNLAVTSDSFYAGLFGRLYGPSIRNIVVDSSCSFTCTFTGSGFAIIGGIVGDIYPGERNSIIENIVNMATLTFNGEIQSSGCTAIGGIVGTFQPSEYSSSYVKNCVNHGSIKFIGTNTEGYLGGIVGGVYYSTTYNTYIFNCINYGTITHIDKKLILCSLEVS